MKERLSGAMLDMLVSVKNHGKPFYHIRGQSAHGGSESTFLALKRRALICVRSDGEAWELTSPGISALEKYRP